MSLMIKFMDNTGLVDFLAISVIGALLSLAFEYFKSTKGTSSKLWAIGLSVVVGGVYVFVRDTVWYSTILGILAASSTIYALFLNNK